MRKSQVFLRFWAIFLRKTSGNAEMCDFIVKKFTIKKKQICVAVGRMVSRKTIVRTLFFRGQKKRTPSARRSFWRKLFRLVLAKKTYSSSNSDDVILVGVLLTFFKITDSPDIIIVNVFPLIAKGTSVPSSSMILFLDTEMLSL